MAETVKLDFGEWDAAIKKTLVALSRKDNLLLSAWNIFGFKDLIDHFQKEQGPDGRWKERKTSTNDAYDRIRNVANPRVSRLSSGVPRGSYNSSNLILQLTGNLRKSAGTAQVKPHGGDTIEISSASPYGATHDQGSSSKNIPQREFMWLSDRAKDLMVKSILDVIGRGGLE